jgi:TrbL/VirB6 plasmid conjugal transfer protein
MRYLSLSYSVYFLCVSVLMFGAYGALAGPAIPTPMDIVAGPYAEAIGGLKNYCPENGTLFARINGCLEETIFTAGLEFIYLVHPYFEGTVTAVLIIAALLFGVMMATGAIERIARDTMLFILKLGGVLYFVDNSAVLYNDFFEMLRGTLQEISQAGLTEGAGMRCGTALEGTGAEFIWNRADCVFDSLVGVSSSIAIGGGGGYEGLSRGLMGFFYYNLQSGALGVLIGSIGIYVGFNLLLALLRASYTYIISLLMLSFLFIIGIFMVPLIMFKNSYEYFSRWVKMVLSMILQPLILFAYLNVMFIAFDFMLYSSPTSLVQTIVGLAPVDVTSPTFNLNEYAEANGLYAQDSKGIGATIDNSCLDRETTSENEGIFGNIEYSPVPLSYQDGVGSGCAAQDLPIHLKYRTVNYDAIPGGAGAIAGSMLLVGLASYVLLTFMAEVPQLAQDLGGGMYATPAVIAGSEGGASLPLSGAAQQLGSNINRGISSQLGALSSLRR